MIISRTQGKIR